MDNALYNHTLSWTRQVESSKNKDILTRNVLIEKNSRNSTYEEDVEYLQDRMFKSLMVPKKYFNLKNENSLTREVLLEKYDGHKNSIKSWENSEVISSLHKDITNIAQLYENQAYHLLNANKTIGVSSRGFGVLFEKQTLFSKIKTFFIITWQKIFKKKEKNLLPFMIRVSARTIMNDIVSVQPLSMPTGQLFYFPKYEREDVFTRKVIVEKHQSPIIQFKTYTVPIFNEQVHDGPMGR